MNDPVGYAVAALFVIGFICGLVKQMNYTSALKKEKGANKKLLYVNYLTSLSLAGFAVSYLLNILIVLQVIQSGALTSNGTVLICFSFLALFIISKFVIIPKKANRLTSL